MEAKKRQVVHSAVAHHPLTDAWAVICPPGSAPPSLYTGQDVLWCGMDIGY